MVLATSTEYRHVSSPQRETSGSLVWRGQPSGASSLKFDSITEAP
jgi:hypothetical protein